MTIETLSAREVSQSEIARLLGVTEGAVRYRRKRIESGAIDGRTRQQLRAAGVLEAIEHWRSQQAWLDCHTEGFKRVGGVSATVRVDNEKTAVSRGAGAWGTINPTYRRYAASLLTSP